MTTVVAHFFAEKMTGWREIRLSSLVPRQRGRPSENYTCRHPTGKLIGGGLFERQIPPDDLVSSI